MKKNVFLFFIFLIPLFLCFSCNNLTNKTNNLNNVIDDSVLYCSATLDENEEQCPVCGKTRPERPNLGKCNHEFVDGICTICGKYEVPKCGKCNHEFVDGICSICGKHKAPYCDKSNQQGGKHHHKGNK